MDDVNTGRVPPATLARCDALLRDYARRDNETLSVRAVRRGDFESISPGSFTEDFPAPIIANRIDTMARDMAATLAPLPTFSCTPSSTLNDRSKKFADKRTKIAQNYVASSNLQAQMPDGVDNYHAGGLFVAEVRPDFRSKSPKIKLLDGGLAYPVWDEDLNTVEILTVQYLSEQALAGQYPEQYRQVTSDHPGCIGAGRAKVYRHSDADETIVWLPMAGNMVLDRIPNKLSKCAFVAIPRPMGEDWFAVPRGAFSDLIYPLIAANDFRMLALEATEKSVRAPIVVPTDVPDVPFGPDATIHTSNPAGIQRVRIDVPQGAFQASEILDRDIQVGAMSPGSRSGSVTASVITGRGVDALGEGYSTQVALAQSRIAVGLEKAINLCFEMDEKYWPEEKKEIRGTSLDNPGRVTYTPGHDIDGDYTVNVDYGFLLGLDANRALVFILQAQAAGLISNDTAARNLPIKLNLSEEQNRIQLEQLRNTLLQSIAATSQAIPQMLSQGGDASSILMQMASIIEGIKKGDTVETVILKVFKPAPPPPAPDPAAAPGGQDPMAALAAASGGGGGAVDPATGQPSPEGRPDLQGLIAGLTGAGRPNLSASVMRMQPTRGA